MQKECKDMLACQIRQKDVKYLGGKIFCGSKFLMGERLFRELMLSGSICARKKQRINCSLFLYLHPQT